MHEAVLAGPGADDLDVGVSLIVDGSAILVGGDGNGGDEVDRARLIGEGGGAVEGLGGDDHGEVSQTARSLGVHVFDAFYLVGRSGLPSA